MTTARSGVRFALLGPLRAWDTRGRAVELGGRKQAMVLAALLVHANEPVSLDRLIALVWGERPPPSAEVTLQGYISHLRRILEPDRRPRTPSRVIASRAGGYVAVVDREHFDVTRFEDLLARARSSWQEHPKAARADLEQALGLWRGEALAEFAYEPFALGPARRLEELRLGAVEDLMELTIAGGRHAEVVPELERLVQAHPLRERLWGQLMLALYRSGRQADALEAYRRLRVSLADGLGLEPSGQVRELEAAILAQDPALDLVAPLPSESARPGAAVPGGAMRRDAVGEVPLVGRDGELADLVGALERAAAGAPTVLLVEGEIGAGKSRLLREMADLAEARGALVVDGGCLDVADAPAYWPWSRVLHGVREAIGAAVLREAAGPWADVVERLLPDGGDCGELPANPLPVAEAVGAALRAVSATTPVLVAFDDFDRADPASLSVLEVLAETLRGAGVVIVASYRAVEVPTAAMTALTAHVARLPWVCHVELGGLDEHAVRLVLAEISGQPVSAVAAAALRRRTGGNPLFVVELARASGREPELADAGGPAPPAVLRDAVRMRLGSLPEETRAILTTAAVAGAEFAIDVVARAARMDHDEERCVDAADVGILNRLLVQAARPGWLRFRHELVREVLLADVPLLRRDLLRRRLAEALRESGRASDDFLLWDSADALAHATAEVAQPLG